MAPVAMRKFALALAIAMSGAVMACTTNPTPIVALGSWGGSHLSMEVTAEGARLEYDCAVGVIDEPLRPDAKGQFTASGRHGGPIRVDETLPSFRARYDGHVDGDQMSLRVTLTETGTQLGPFDLRRGNSGLVFRCL